MSSRKTAMAVLKASLPQTTSTNKPKLIPGGTGRVSRFKKFQEKGRNIQDSLVYGLPMLVATAWSLTAYYIQNAALPKSVDK